MKIVSLCICFLFISFSESQAQGNGVFYALEEFLNTDFFREYEHLKVQAEKSVKDFKIIQSRYSEDEVASLKDSYNACAVMFNMTLLNIKADMLHKEKRKYMIDYPESYSKQVETDLYRAKDFYINTYQKEIISLTNGEISGFAFLALLPQIIQYSTLAFEYIKKIKEQMEKIKEEMIDKHLIEPYSFKSWDEI